MWSVFENNSRKYSRKKTSMCFLKVWFFTQNSSNISQAYCDHDQTQASSILSSKMSRPFAFTLRLHSFWSVFCHVAQCINKECVDAKLCDCFLSTHTHAVRLILKHSFWQAWLKLTELVSGAWAKRREREGDHNRNSWGIFLIIRH